MQRWPLFWTLWPGGVTSWLLANRKYFGLAFAFGMGFFLPVALLLVAALLLRGAAWPAGRASRAPLTAADTGWLEWN